jgi:hypothetical protein
MFLKLHSDLFSFALDVNQNSMSCFSCQLIEFVKDKKLLRQRECPVIAVFPWCTDVSPQAVHRAEVSVTGVAAVLSALEVSIQCIGVNHGIECMAA